VGWTVAFLAAGLGLTIAFVTILFRLTGVIPVPQHPTVTDLLLQTAAGLLGYGIVTLLLGVKLLHLSGEDLRWAPLSRAGRGFVLGLVVGAVPAIVAIGLSLPLGGAALLPDAGGPGLYFRQVGLTFLVLAPAALFEELVFRGVGQVLLAKAVGRIPAMVLLSVLFALAHIKNDNVTTLGLTNIALAGIFLGLAFYAPGGIWTAWGAHLGWNTTLAAFDAPVSGLPFSIPLINYQPGGPSWLTGGSFGPEGGILASVALVMMTAAVWNWTRKETA
jgi:membrane protease YdiL (CAAX protease family)